MKTTLSLLLFGLSTIATPAPAENVPSKATMANLQTAFNGESNAHARYLAFAQRADIEGYPGAAALFRAAAAAEEIHARNHADVIRNYGGVPAVNIVDPFVKSTRENLTTAVNGEMAERDHMYPAFISRAKADMADEVVRTFRFALAAETEHARLYQELIDNPAMMSVDRVFYVCPICGFTTPDPNLERCPVCETARERFSEIS